MQCLGEAMAHWHRRSSSYSLSLCFLGVRLLEKASRLMSCKRLHLQGSEHDEIMDPGNDASRSLAQQQCTDPNLSMDAMMLALYQYDTGRHGI